MVAGESKPKVKGARELQEDDEGLAEDWVKDIKESLQQASDEQHGLPIFKSTFSGRPVDEVLSEVTATDVHLIDKAIDDIRDELNSDPDTVFAHIRKLFHTLWEGLLGDPGQPLPDRGDVKSTMWGCMKLAAVIKDGAAVFPSTGETYFDDIFKVLKVLAERGVRTHDAQSTLITTTLLSLWTPQLSSRPALYDTAIPICVKFLGSEHPGIKYASTCLLQTMGRVRPDLLGSRMEDLAQRVRSGYMADIPILVSLFGIQPESRRLFEEHFDWLISLFKDHPQQRSAIAESFRGLSHSFPEAFLPYIPKLWPFIRDDKCGSSLSLALAAAARSQPANFHTLIPDVKGAMSDARKHAPALACLLRSCCTELHAAKDAVSSMAQVLEDGAPTFIEPAGEEIVNTDPVARWIEGILNEIGQLAATIPGCTAHVLPKLQEFIRHDDPGVRDAMSRITQTGGDSSGWIRTSENDHDENADFPQTAFCAIYCKKFKPWEHYFEVARGDRTRNVPLLMMIMRSDGMVGLPGGTVEPGETAEGAVRRELREEIGLGDPGKLVPVCTHSHPPSQSRTHLFAKEVDEEMYMSIENAAKRAPHFGAETMGVFRAPLFTSGLAPTLGLETFLKGNMPTGLIEQLAFLLSLKALVPSTELSKCLTAAGQDPITLMHRRKRVNADDVLNRKIGAKG